MITDKKYLNVLEKYFLSKRNTFMFYNCGQFLFMYSNYFKSTVCILKINLRLLVFFICFKFSHSNFTIQNISNNSNAVELITSNNFFSLFINTLINE